MIGFSLISLVDLRALKILKHKSVMLLLKRAQCLPVFLAEKKLKHWRRCKMETIDKSNDNGEKKQTQEPVYSIIVDNELHPNLLTITIPIGKIIMNDSK